MKLVMCFLNALVLASSIVIFCFIVFDHKNTIEDKLIILSIGIFCCGNIVAILTKHKDD